MYYDSSHVLEAKKIPGAKETLEKVLSKGICIFLSSINSNRENVFRKLSVSGLIKYFKEDLIFVDPKSKVELITRAYKKTRINPSETVFVGDTVVDIRDAKKAGVASIAISNKYSFHPKTCLEKENPNYPVLKDIREVLKII